MSESCPNCGSAVNENSRYNVGGYQKYECGCMTSGFGDSQKACPTKACGLIRSLREELAELDERLGIVVGDRDEALGLLASLREELAEAKNRLENSISAHATDVEVMRGFSQQARDAERDQIADWLTDQARISEEIWMEQRERVDMGFGEYHRGSMNAEHQAVNALRNNEHRSNG